VSTPTDPAPHDTRPADFFQSEHAPLPADARDAAHGGGGGAAVIDPDDPPWGVGAGLFVWFASVALMFAMSLGALVVYFIIHGAPRPANGDVGSALQNDPALIVYSLASLIPTHALTLVLVWVVVTNFGKRPFWRTIGWAWSPRLGALSSAGVAVLLLLVSLAAITLFGSGVKTQLDEILESSVEARFITAFLAVAGAPLVEELVYRGVLFPSVRRGLTRLVVLLRAAPPDAPEQTATGAEVRAPGLFHRGLLSALTFGSLSPERVGTVWAVLLVTLLFAGVHVAQYYNNPAVILVVGTLGFVLTYVRARTGRLLPCFFIHLVFNGIQSAFLVAEHFVEKPGEADAAAQGVVAASLIPLAINLAPHLLP
jgi:membrane protease YdiL (CAAX protease family)